MVPSCLPRYCRLLWPPSIDSLIAGALSAKASSDARFAGKSSDLISGQPKEAATGIYGFIGYGEVELRQRCLEGTAAIVKARRTTILAPKPVFRAAVELAQGCHSARGRAVTRTASLTSSRSRSLQPIAH